MNNKPYTVVAAVVTIIAIIAGVILAAALYGGIDKDEVTPLIVMLLTLGGTTIPVIINLAKTETVAQEQQQVRKDLQNGAIEENLAAALEDHPNVKIIPEKEVNSNG